MGVVVVKARTVAEYQIAFDFRETQFPLRVLSEVMRFIEVLAKFIDMKTTHVGVWILGIVIPTHAHPRLRRAANQRDRFGNNIQIIGVIASDTDFGFDAELN
jgi:hypothetical protein